MDWDRWTRTEKKRWLAARDWKCVKSADTDFLSFMSLNKKKCNCISDVIAVFQELPSSAAVFWVWIDGLVWQTAPISVFSYVKQWRKRPRIPLRPPTTFPKQICWWQILKATSSPQRRSNEVKSLCPDSRPPRHHIYTAHSGVIKAPRESNPWQRRVLSLRLTVWILARENPSDECLSAPFFFLPLWETERVCSKRRCRQRRFHPGFLRALLLSAQPRPRRLSPRRNCMLAETIGVIEYIPQTVLGYSSLVSLIDDICLTCDLYHAALWETGHHSKVIHYLEEQEVPRGRAICSTIQYTGKAVMI